MPDSPPAAGRVHCFTSATLAYVDRVRVLCETLRRHHPEWHLTLCLCDRLPPGIDAAQLADLDAVVGIEALDIPDLPRFLFDHDVVELCTAAKGPMLLRLLEQGAQKVIYLDPDIALFDSLAPIVDLLDHASIVLTPHQLEPDEAMPAILNNERNTLRYGIFNLGFLAVAGDDEGLRFARWWCQRLLVFCFDELADGLFTDQKWCDHVPAFFAGAHVLRDPGCNVASWNLSRRRITIGEDGRILAGGATLRFFHFTKISAAGERMIEAHAAGLEVFELVHWYRGRLAAHAARELADTSFAFGQYADGTAILPEHRRRYRASAALRAAWPDPIATNPFLQ